MAGDSRLATTLRWIPALLWMAGIFWLSSREALPSPPGLSYAVGAVIAHFMAYLILTLLLLFALADSGLPRGRMLLVAGAIAGLYGLSDEFHQYFVPGRDASIEDLIVDLAGVACALGIWSLRWRRAATS